MRMSPRGKYLSAIKVSWISGHSARQMPLRQLPLLGIWECAVRCVVGSAMNVGSRDGTLVVRLLDHLLWDEVAERGRP